MVPTMREVAAQAGVSITSVSRVVNGHPHISDDIRERVEAAIRELDWRPNLHARTLRTGRTGVLALSLPDLTTPTASRMVQELVTEAARQGMLVSIEPSRGRAERVQQTIDALGASFDGVVHVGPLPAGVAVDSAPDPALGPAVAPASGSAVVAAAAAGPRALVGVMTGAPPDEPPAGMDLVEADEAAAALAVARHLRTLGRTAPVLLGHPAGRPDEHLRRLAEVLPGAPVLRPRDQADRAAGRALAAAALAAHPDLDALVCADDELAIGALSLLRGRGIGVPDPVAIVGHGGLEDTGFTTPSLTTVDLGATEMARRAVDLVRSRLEDPRRPLQRTVAPISLLRRESTLGGPR
ncbi:LacI family DNA-binding transcriptional regulator [Brachybacterium sp. DNPG3]